MLQKRVAPASSDSDTRSASTPLVSVRALSVAYPLRTGQQSLVHALTDVSIDIPHGASFGIFGESGCGKTTLLLSIANLLRSETITRGSVLFDGLDLLMQSEHALQSIRGALIGVVLQEAAAALNPVRKIGPQLAEIVRAHQSVSGRESRDAALDALTDVGLDANRVFGAWPHQLSGGQRQRVLIAQALIGRPALLLADEPTHALDDRTREQIVELLERRAADWGMALLIASHNPQVLQARTQRLFVFYAGQLIESGPTEDVLFNPLHPYTRALVKCFHLEPRNGREMPARMKTIPGSSPQSSGHATGCRFVTRCAHRRAACSELTPALLPVTANQEVRCILYD